MTVRSGAFGQREGRHVVGRESHHEVLAFMLVGNAMDEVVNPRIRGR
jgi:hypothetical protein